MPNVDRRWLPLVLIAMSAVASLVAYGRLPAMVDLRLGGMLPVDTTETAEPIPRWLALWAMPVLALVLWAAFRAVPTAAGARVGRFLFRRAPQQVTSPEQFERFRNSYDTIVLSVVMLILGVHTAILTGAMGHPEIATRIIPAVLGVCLVMMGMSCRGCDPTGSRVCASRARSRIRRSGASRTARLALRSFCRDW